MNDVIVDLISQGVDYLLTAVIISSIVTMMATAQNINSEVTEQQAIHEEIMEYRKHNQFNDKEVYAQDVISAIMKYRGLPYVRVKIGSNTYTWSTREQATNYSASAVDDIVTSDYIYDADLVVDPSGVVIGYEFVAK